MMFKNKKVLFLSVVLFITAVPQVVLAKDVIEANGELESVETDSFSPPKVRRIWQYTIAYMAEDGTQVAPGQPILMFKTDVLKERLLDKQGELGVKQSELKNTQVSKIETLQDKELVIAEKKMLLDKAKRKAELPKSVIAGNEYEENQLNHELAKIEFKHAQDDYQLHAEKLTTEEQILQANITKLSAEVEELQGSIKSMRMMSKRKGIVMHQRNWNNNKFAVGDSVWGGQRVAEVADLEQIVGKLAINENDMSRVEEGQRIKFRMDAYPDKEFQGVIQSLSKVVRTKSPNQPSKILDAVVSIDNIDREIMRPGMRIKAEIMTGDNDA